MAARFVSLTTTATYEASVFWREGSEQNEAFFNDIKEAMLFADRKSYLAPFDVTVCFLMTHYMNGKRWFTGNLVKKISKGEVIDGA